MKQFFREAFSEPEGGRASFGRIASAIIIAFALGWGSAILWWTHKIDADNVKAILEIGVALYAANKFPTMLAGAIASKQNPQSSP